MKCVILAILTVGGVTGLLMGNVHWGGLGALLLLSVAWSLCESIRQRKLDSEIDRVYGSVPPRELPGPTAIARQPIRRPARKTRLTQPVEFAA